MLYPPGFHLLTAMISRLSGIGPLEVFPILAPMLPLMGALALYALAKRLWGWEYGVAAALTAGLLLGGTYLHFEEARYPNFIGEYFLIVLAIAALVGMYAAPSARAGLLLALLGSSTVLYHQIAGYSLAVLLGLVCVLFLPYLLLRERRKGVYLALSLALLGLLSVAYAWDTYDLPSLVVGMLGGSETGRGGEAVAMAIGTKPANGPGHFLTTMSHPVLWLGLLGLALMLAGGKDAKGTPDILARLTLLVWTLLLFFGSLTSYSGFPDRFERDLGVPLALLAALTLVTLVRLSTPLGRTRRLCGGPARRYPLDHPRRCAIRTEPGASRRTQRAPQRQAGSGRGRRRRGVARAAQRRRKHSRDPLPGVRPEPGHARDGRVHADAVLRRGQDKAGEGPPALRGPSAVGRAVGAGASGGRAYRTAPGEERRALHSVPQALSLDRLASFRAPGGPLQDGLRERQRHHLRAPPELATAGPDQPAPYGIPEQSRLIVERR